MKASDKLKELLARRGLLAMQFEEIEAEIARVKHLIDAARHEAEAEARAEVETVTPERV